MVFDVDSTLINEEAIELLAKHAGTFEQVSAITERAMAGALDFTQSLHERVATLEGLDSSVLDSVAKELTPTKGARELIQAIHDRGGKAAAVSGGFIQLLDGIKHELGFDFESANTLEILDNKLTGKVIGSIIDQAAKAQALMHWAESLQLPLAKTIAVGDGANDLGMMEIAGLSVAFCAKPVVRQKAKIALNERDLSQLIKLLP